jgi:hypothetical protein
VVLAIEATEARGSELSFLPGLAFAIILATNLLLVFGSLRGRRTALAGAEAGATSAAPAVSVVAGGQAATVAADHRRWFLDAVLLALLALAGGVLWYGNQPVASRPPRVEKWIHSHLHRWK